MARSHSLNDGTVKVQSSSIALLQERFKQLQRAKEMREERELLRQLIAESAERANPGQSAAHFEPNGFVFQSEMTGSQCKPQPQVSMYLQPNYLQSTQNYQAVMRRLSKLDESDVDTSLHL